MVDDPPLEIDPEEPDSPTDKNRAEIKAFTQELQREAQAQGFLGKFLGGKENIPNNIMGLMGISLLFILALITLVELFSKDFVASTTDAIVSLLTLVIGFFAGRYMRE